MSGKRTDYIGWDACFMEMAFTIAKRSKDPSTQVGACIVNTENRVVSMGYNGFPNGCNDDELTWEKDMTKPTNKYMFVVHAELNAIINAKKDISNCTLYVTHFPCNECAKAIIQSGIKHVVFQNFYNKNAMIVYDMFTRAGVTLWQYNPEEEYRKGDTSVQVSWHDMKLLIAKYESEKAMDLAAKNNTIKPISGSLEEFKETQIKPKSRTQSLIDRYI